MDELARKDCPLVLVQYKVIKGKNIRKMSNRKDIDDALYDENRTDARRNTIQHTKTGEPTST